MTKILTNRWSHILILLVLLAGVVTVRMQDYGWTRAFGYLAFDSYNNIFPRSPSGQVVVVDIDEASLAHETLGQWPWPRTAVAQLVRNLHAMGARAIVFDMVFAEDDRTSPQSLLRTMPDDMLNDEFGRQILSLPDHDEMLADAFRKAGNVVTGFIWTGRAESTRRRPVQSRPIMLSREAEGLRRSVAHMPGVTTNIPVLSRAAAGNGSFGVSTDIDGLIRTVPLLFRLDHPERDRPDIYPALSMEALRVAQDPRLMIRVRQRAAHELGLFDPPYLMQVGNYEIPLDRDGSFYVYFSKARQSEYIPAWRVFENEIDPARVSGKIVFVGTSAEGLRDIRSTPLNLFVAGVEVHMNVVEQILQGAYLSRPQLNAGVELSAIVVVGFLIIFLAPFIGAAYMALFTLTLIGVSVLLSMYSYVEWGLLFDPVYPGLSLFALYVVSSLLTYIRSESERRQVRRAFGLYISPDYMRELTRHPGRLKLGGSVRELSVMFTDIRNFTSISEAMSPEALIQLMNDFLTPMSDVVMKNRGTIDKYMGDAMMAFWNAPLDDADHARHACISALKMNEALAPINRKLAEQGVPVNLQAGIGINTGPASVGNMGSRQRFAYSALGDTVNLASRLESQTKTYGVDILIGETTQAHVPELATLELDLLQVKGKEKPVRVFALLGDERYAADDLFKAWKIAHDTLIKTYRGGDFEAAEKQLKLCAAMDSDRRLDAFYNLYGKRIKTLKKHHPGEDWDGVYVAAAK